MKLALINMGNNVTNFKTTPSAETLYIAKSIREMGYDLDVVSIKTSDTTIAYEEVNPNSYDKLIVLNGAVNFFGGVENPYVIAAQKFMSAYKSKIYYLLTDIRLSFQQCWHIAQKKSFAYKFTKDELFINSQIKIISQGKNLEISKFAHKKALKDTSLEFEYFPLDQYKIHDDTFEFACSSEKEVDLIYGGSFRAGQREAKMVEFLFDTGLSVEFFGNAKSSQFKNPKFSWNESPDFTGKVPMSSVAQKNSSAFATIIIGDKNYNDNFITLRVWETLSSDAVVLIDEDFDNNHSIIDDPRFYVKSREELIERVNEIKDNNKLREELIDIQHSRVIEEQAKKSEWQHNFKRVLDLV